MGVWAEGNFDNDSALDLVSDVADDMSKEMNPPFEIEDLDMVMAAVAVHKALVEHCHAPAPPLKQIKAIRSAVLETYDEEIDGLDPDPEFKTARRKVIEDTFNGFEALLKH